MDLTQDQANQLVEWLSEIGDLSYAAAPDPNPVGVGIRLRVQSCKHILNADPPPPPPDPTPAPAIMYDSTTAADIPANAQIVAGYVDGAFAWSDADKARFPKFISISVNGGSMADFWDCELGDLNAGQAAAMIQTYPGTGVYCSLDTAPQVISACHWAGLDGQYVLWIADWTGQAHIPSVSAVINGQTIIPEVVACQYANPATSGGHYDLSIVTPAFLAKF